MSTPPPTDVIPSTLDAHHQKESSADVQGYDVEPDDEPTAPASAAAADNISVVAAGLDNLVLYEEPTQTAAYEPTPVTTALLPSSSSPAPIPAAAVAQTAATPSTSLDIIEEPVTSSSDSNVLPTLQDMFPNFDITLLQSVLKSANGKLHRAIEILLGMNDPEYEPIPQSVPPQLSQTDEDEQLAHRLLWEEQQLVLAQRVPPGTGQNAPYGWDPERGGAYPTRRGRRSSPPAPGGGRGGSGTPSGPTAPEFQEHISLFAKNARDVSKKTFSSIVSKVKAKIHEYDQGRQGNASNEVVPNWGSGTPGGHKYVRQTAEQPQPHSAPTVGAGPASRSVPQPPKDHNKDSPSMADSPYVAPSLDRPGQGSDTSHSASGPNPVVDYGKIGLLPKRPVSLLAADGPNANKPREDDDADELEYVENPFEQKG
jgi:hypothetical protein